MNEQSNGAVLEQIREAMDKAAAGRVFAEPVTRDGVTVLPVAKVSGGGGGGNGTGMAPSRPDRAGRAASRAATDSGGDSGTGSEVGSGAGSGFGVSARPLGVFVIKDGTVAWRPALDLNRVIIGGQIVAVVALLTLRAIVKRWRS